MSSLADGSNKLDYGKFEMEDARTSVLKVGGKDEKWLLVGNGLALHIFDLDIFAADPVIRTMDENNPNFGRYRMSRKGSRQNRGRARLFLEIECWPWLVTRSLKSTVKTDAYLILDSKPSCCRLMKRLEKS